MAQRSTQAVQEVLLSYDAAGTTKAIATQAVQEALLTYGADSNTVIIITQIAIEVLRSVAVSAANPSQAVIF